MREKHIVPGYLHRPERRMIFGRKNKQQLEDNPTSAYVAGEEVELQWIDREREIPNRTKLFHEAVDGMAEHGDWNNLPSLLTGLKHSGAKLEEKAMAKIVRKAVSAGKIGIVVQCLQQAENTGMTLQIEEVLQHVVWGLHSTAQQDGWSEEATLKALKAANQVSLLLERDEHGGGRALRPNDPRMRPEVVAVFLELASVYAYQYQGSKDTDGKVKTYASRLISCLEAHPPAAQPSGFAPRKAGPQLEMLHGVPIWHGLQLSSKILGKEWPRPDLASKVRNDYEAGLKILAEAIQAQGAKGGSYGEQAVRCWRDCIRE